MTRAIVKTARTRVEGEAMMLPGLVHPAEIKCISAYSLRENVKSVTSSGSYSNPPPGFVGGGSVLNTLVANCSNRERNDEELTLIVTSHRNVCLTVETISW